jgi:hypothetical protein
MPKGCYTCRRRRIKCDNGLPSCQKCQKTGRECLGYQKPLVWVKGVASRGKMMGLNFDDVTESSNGKSTQNWEGETNALQLASTPNPPVDEDVSSPLAESRCPLNGDGSLIPRETSQGTNCPLSCSREGALRIKHEFSAFMSIGPFNLKHRKLMAPVDADDQERLPPLRGFVDPLFQDLDYLSRFYISYCRQPFYFFPIPWLTFLES